MIKNIIFDYSGPIRETVECSLSIVNSMLRKFGVKELSAEEMRKNWKQPFMEFYNKYIPGLTIEEEIELYKKAIKEYGQGKACPGIIDLIKDLKKSGKKMAIVSSDFPELVLPELEKFGIKGLFDEISLGMHDKQEAVEDLLVKNNFRPEETIFVGDSAHEIEVGKKAGTKTAAVLWGIDTEEKLRKAQPDFAVKNVEELRQILI